MPVGEVLKIVKSLRFLLGRKLENKRRKRNIHIVHTGVGPFAEDDEDGEDDAAFTLQAVTDAIGKTPEKALLRMIYARLGDGKSEGYFRSYWNSYTMKHEENEKLDRIYALLVKLGYEMSDDEKALQDGTHELFGEATDE